MVVGIIALLIGILLPALGRARAVANSVKCLANLRTIGQACQMAAAEHGGYMGFGPTPWLSSGTPPQMLNDAYLNRYLYFDDASGKQVLPLMGSLSSYLGQKGLRTDSTAHVTADLASGMARRIFTCPSQGDVKVGCMTGWLTAKVDCYSSYAFNEGAFGEAQGGSDLNLRRRGKLLAIQRPSENCLFFDGLPRVNYGDSLLILSPDGPNQSAYNDRLNGVIDPKRHNKSMNVLFADFHAGSAPTSDNGLKTIGLTLGF